MRWRCRCNQVDTIFSNQNIQSKSCKRTRRRVRALASFLGTQKVPNPCHQTVCSKLLQEQWAPWLALYCLLLNWSHEFTQNIDLWWQPSWVVHENPSKLECARSLGQCRLLQAVHKRHQMIRSTNGLKLAMISAGCCSFASCRCLLRIFRNLDIRFLSMSLSSCMA